MQSLLNCCDIKWITNSSGITVIGIWSGVVTVCFICSATHTTVYEFPITAQHQVYSFIKFICYTKLSEFHQNLTEWPSRWLTSLLGCLELDVTELASLKAENERGRNSGSLVVEPYVEPFITDGCSKGAVGTKVSVGCCFSRGFSGMLRRCTVRKKTQVSAEKK